MSPRLTHNRPKRSRAHLEERPVLQLPLHRPPESIEEEDDEEKVERGVAVVDFYI